MKAAKNRTVTNVMYHYVRDLERSRFPKIKALELERFRRQLDHVQEHYNPITVEDLINTVGSESQDLPENAILLTFDDGYSDHFANVLPLLQARGIQGAFFPPAQAVLEHKVLDVNKIHFVLASTSDIAGLLEQIFSLMEELGKAFELEPRDHYLQKAREEHRFDSQEVVLLKRLLQRELPLPVRTEIVGRLFAQHVTADEAAFASELYMSVDQIEELRAAGMHIGSHGYSHAWLNHLSADEQASEIDQSLGFLRNLGVPSENWTMCYPYGGFNGALLQHLENRSCRLGFGVEARIADLDRDNYLVLPRIDTNDLPS